MKSLEQLPEMTARQLGGLEATPRLMAKIKQTAAQGRPRRATRVYLRPALAACLALVVVAGGLLALGGIPGGVRGPNVIDSHSAGKETKATEAPALSADLPVGSIAMGGGKSGAQTLFADAQGGGSFPLITVGGATYRMLRTPDGISGGLLGGELGTVSEYNVEPALGSASIVSNAVSQGETVYAVAGMEGAMVAANANGSMRVFQRVSYAGMATLGSESLADTLCSAGDVQWIELSGVGSVQGADAQTLMGALLSGADYQSTGMSGGGSLQIGLNNGLTLQLLVGDDTVSACGTWSCPDFFEAFHEAVGR